MKNITQTLKYSESKHTVHLESDLRVAVIVMSTITESGLEAIDFVLKAADSKLNTPVLSRA